MFPPAAGVSERERRKRERSERKRMRKEWRELERRQEELRQLYVCPVEADMQRAGLRASGRHRKLRDRYDSGYDFDQFGTGASTDLFRGPGKPTPLKRFTRPQIIGGILYHCECGKRNGLQDGCRIALCQGRPECLTNPPMCLPSGGLGCNLPICPFCNAPVTAEPYAAEYDSY
jgi:hypothetical protein